MNQVLIIGKVADLPRLIKNSNGIASTCLLVDTYRKEKNANGNYDIDRLSVSFTGDLAENICKNLIHGDAIIVRGRLQSQNYEENGEVVYKSIIVGDSVTMLDQII